MKATCTHYQGVCDHLVCLRWTNMTSVTAPRNPFSTLDRKQKLALAARDPHAMRIHLDDLDHAVGADVLRRCDKYAKDRSK